MSQAIAAERRALIQSLFPDGVPTLWSPLLTHYRPEGGLDQERMRRHLQYVLPHVRHFLIPGSTGDGWEMTDDEIFELLTFMLDEAADLGMTILIGVLKTEPEATLEALQAILHWLEDRAGSPSGADALKPNHVCGFAVCAPKGATRSQEEIRSALAAALDLGVPTALYQLPQVTENEFSPETVRDLVGKYPNFYLLKDSSGADRVARAGVDLDELLLLRGAEGDYATWAAQAGGPYHGFLLSTTNSFPARLAQLLELLDQGRREEAVAISEQLSRAINEAFGCVREMSVGNQYTNANKAFDHFNAHGPGALAVPPPRLHAGARIPSEALQGIRDVLVRNQLMPSDGYAVG